MIETNPKTQSILVLSYLLTNPDVTWQVHNCKITEQTVTQDGTLPLMYHYDALPDDLKSAHPLTGDLLKQFNTNMTTQEAAKKLGIHSELMAKPWFVKLTGTVVLFCEALQIAIRLKFTNTAKSADPIYCTAAEHALQLAIKNWHCFGEVYVLNKSLTSIQVTEDIDTDIALLAPLPTYQLLPKPCALAILALIDSDTSSHNHIRQMIDQAIQQRLG